MTRRLLMLISAMMLAAGLIPLAASADHCGDIQVIIFGNNGAPVSVNMGAVGCEVTSDTGSEVDLNYLSPGTSSVSVRLIGLDLGKSTPQVTATLNGLSLTDKAVTLKRTVDSTTGSVTYDSDDVAVSGTGEIKAVVKTPQGDYTGKYKTLI